MNIPPEQTSSLDYCYSLISFYEIQMMKETIEAEFLGDYDKAGRIRSRLLDYQSAHNYKGPNN